jgi:hypothetical protein
MPNQRREPATAGKAAQRAIGFNEHLEFFDSNHDHKISLRESAQGLERLGFGHLLSVPAAVAIGFGVTGLGLLQGRVVNPTNLELPSTGFVRHPDSELVNEQGEFDDARLDALFATYGQKFAGSALTVSELAAMLAERVRADARSGKRERLLLPVGATAVAVEWGALLWIAGEKRDGTLVLAKETVRRFYTSPHFFDDVARRIAEQRKQRESSKLGALRNVVQDWLV